MKLIFSFSSFHLQLVSIRGKLYSVGLWSEVIHCEKARCSHHVSASLRISLNNCSSLGVLQQKPNKKILTMHEKVGALTSCPRAAQCGWTYCLNVLSECMVWMYCLNFVWMCCLNVLSGRIVWMSERIVWMFELLSGCIVWTYCLKILSERIAWKYCLGVLSECILSECIVWVYIVWVYCLNVWMSLSIV